jgi:ABC-2 type transport system permease protein
MTRFLSLEVVRALRDPRYLILAVGMPVGLYLLFTQLFGAHGERVEGIPQVVELMIAMATYGGIWSVLSATAPRIAAERQTGWLRQLRLTPLPARSVISSKVVAAVATALPAMILVCLTAVVAHGVHLSVQTWVEMLALMCAGTLPLALLGVAIGFLVGSDAAYGVVMILYFAFGAMGGLWMPLAMLPDGDVLPSHGIASLGWRLAAGQPLQASSFLVLSAWTLGCGLLAFLAYRRSAVR